LTFAEDSQSAIIAHRVTTNAQWASVYLAYFEASNEFHRANSALLNADAREMLSVLNRALPRVSSTCLCRLWDQPGTDRHSLLALSKIAEFRSEATTRDPAFIDDCNALSSSNLVSRLRRFRIVDLAHNLAIGSESGFSYDELRELVRKTQSIADRLSAIMRFSNALQSQIFEMKRNSCESFWDSIRSVITYPELAELGSTAG